MPATIAVYGKASVEQWDKAIKKAHQMRDEVAQAGDKMSTAGKKMSGASQAAGKSSGTFVDLAAKLYVIRDVAQMAAGVVSYFGQAVAEDQKSTARLAQAVKNTGANLAALNPQLEASIQAGMRLGYSDEQAADALSTLTAITGSATKAMKLQAIAMDLSRGAGIDLGAASKLIGKVAEGNMTALKRYGIVLDKNATKEEALAAIQKKFGGQAAAYANTAGGAMDRLKATFGETIDKIGLAFAPVATKLLMLLAKFAPVLANLVLPVVARLGEWLDKLVSGAGSASGVFGGLMATVRQVFEQVRPQVQAFVREIGPTFKAFVAELAATWKQIAPIVVPVLKFVLTYVGAVLNNILGAIRVVMALIRGDWKGAWAIIKQTFTTFWRTIGEAAWNLAKSIVPAFLRLGGQIVDGIKKGIADAWSSMVRWWTDKISGLVDGAKHLLGIKSPSTVFAGIGAQIAAGLAQGMNGGMGVVSSAAARMAGAATFSASASFGATPALAAAGGAYSGSYSSRSVTIAPGAVQIVFPAGSAGSAGDVEATIDRALKKLADEIRRR